ncbi:MAG: hypothetical protein ACI8RZ_006494, partial [Myxococcota bacterium]
MSTLTDEQAKALTDELAEALETMIDTSCADMGPLWLEATRRARNGLGSARVPNLGFAPSAKYLALGKSSRSKYRGLAAWRHAVLWQGVLGEIEDEDFREALRTVYFTPFPTNKPPYAWSSKASAAPGVGQFESPTTLKHQAKEGCFQTVQVLRDIRHTLLYEGPMDATI